MPQRAPLKLFPLASPIASPSGGTWRVELSDPALSVMTDFSDRNMVSVNAEQQVDAALALMKHAGVRSAFVVDDSRARVLGVITAYDIMSEKSLRFQQETGGNHPTSARADVQVKDIMERTESLLVARILDIEQATVGCVRDALQLSRRSHIAVVEPGTDKQPRLRGIFSRERLLRLTETSRHWSSRHRNRESRGDAHEVTRNRPTRAAAARSLAETPKGGTLRVFRGADE